MSNRATDSSLAPIGSSLTSLGHVSKPLAGVRILIAEDHGDTRDILAQVLGSLGAMVVAVVAADEALRMVGAVDILVTDFVLPDRAKDGVWLLKQVNGRQRPIPVILVSAFAESQVPRLAAAPFVRKLLKPADPWELGAIILAVLHEPPGE